MKNVKNEKSKRIIKLLKWFEEFQPSDLDTIERVMLGLRYINKEVVKNELKQSMYNTIKCTRLEKNLKRGNRFLEMFFREDINETIIKDK